MAARWACWKTRWRRSVLPVRGCGSRPRAPRRSRICTHGSHRGAEFLLRRPHRCRAAGDAKLWKHDPFAAAIEGGTLYGRGAVDMKTAVACFAAAAARFLESGKPYGAISLLITGDEEGPTNVNGTRRVLDGWAERGERPRSLHRRRADRDGGDRRRAEDRPARHDERETHRHRHAGPCRLSGEGEQSDPGAGGTGECAGGLETRRRNRAFRSLDAGLHDGRCRQSGDERHSGGGARGFQHPLQRPPQKRRVDRAYRGRSETDRRRARCGDRGRRACGGEPSSRRPARSRPC